MLRRQRTFFLTSNQYEPVVLSYLGLVSGTPWFRFYHEDDAPRYYMHYRTSNDRGRTWSVWVDSSERSVSSGNYTDFYLNYVAGIIIQIAVVMVGDEKDPSEPSNVVDAIIAAQPLQSPPVLDGDVWYENGDAYALINVQEFPTGVSRFVAWRRATGETDWKNIGIGTAKFIVDKSCDNNTTYEYRAAWCDIDNNVLSDYSNTVTVTVPDAQIAYLMPPVKYATEFVDYSGQGYEYDYWNKLTILKGDMRTESVTGQYRKNNGAWTDIAGTYNFEERGIPETQQSYIWWLGHSNRPTAGDVWQYRLKNHATGYTDSEWSELFEITIPSLLPKLPSPVITLSQTGASVIVGWQTVEDATGYKIERKLRTAAEYTVIANNLPASTTQFTDSGTYLGNTYDYRVTALGDGQTYQDSNPTSGSIYISPVVVLEAPVIDSVTESGISVVLVVSNINAPNTLSVQIEMSENNGTWKLLGAGYPASQSETSFTYTVPGESILEGGNLRFRARALPAGMAQDPSPYSEIANITIDEREWLLRWTGTAWDYCTAVTGGWYAPSWTDSDGTHSSNLVAQDLGGGTLRISGANSTTGVGFWTNRTGLTTNNASLSSKYSRVVMLGTLVKQSEGQDYHAWFGTAWDYTFAGGWNMDMGRGTKVIAGSDSGRGAAGSRTDPYVSACGSYTYAPRDGAHVYLYFQNGYADVKGIFAIKR